MKAIYTAAFMLMMVCAASAQGPSMAQQARIRNYFYHNGYQYLQLAHMSCDVKTITVSFPAGENTVIVGLDYEGLFGERFTCNYYFTWENGTFTNLSWDCHSPDDFKCWNGCDLSKSLVVRMMREYQKTHGGERVDNIWHEIEQLFGRQLDQISCAEYCLGFILLDWYSYEG
jgi:hypothetical protein